MKHYIIMLTHKVDCLSRWSLVPICSKNRFIRFQNMMLTRLVTNERTDRRTDERPGRKQTEYKYNITWQATSKASAYRARIAYCKDWNNITREGTQNNQQTLCLTERGRSKSENWPETLESKRSWFPLARCVFVLRAIRRRRVMESRQLWAQLCVVSSHI